MYKRCESLGSPKCSLRVCSLSDLCPSLCDPMDCIPPGSTVHGIPQARILERLAFPPPGDRPNSGIEALSPGLLHCEWVLYCILTIWWPVSEAQDASCFPAHWISLRCTAGPEKAVAPHSSTLAWKIPWTEEPGRLQSIRSRRVGHDWATSLSLFTFMHWRSKWQPTPVFLPGESQGRGSVVGCCLWGRTGSDTTEAT